MKKAPPNRTGKEIWRDMMAWDAQRRRLQIWDGKHHALSIAEYLKRHPPKDGGGKE